MACSRLRNITLQTPSEQRPDRWRRVRRKAIERNRLFEHGRQGLSGGVARERLSAREHLVQHHAKCPDVGAPVGGFALGLFRRHVGRGAQDHVRLASSPWRASASPASSRERVFGECFRQSKIENLDRARRRDLNVRRLQVAMDDSLLMRRFQRFGDLAGVAYDAVWIGSGPPRVSPSTNSITR